MRQRCSSRKTGLFFACHGIDSFYVSFAMMDWFSIWDNHPYTAHLAWYFYKNLKRGVWLNGTFLPQHEAVWPKDVVMHFGTTETGYQLIIETTTAHFRSSTSFDVIPTHRRTILTYRNLTLLFFKAP